MKSHSSRGFTLIELLVVIAIIAILAAILFPVFAEAKNAAKKMVGVNNLKQINTAAMIYQNDYDDAFAPKLRIGYGPTQGGGDPSNAMSFDKIVEPYVKSWDLYYSPLDNRTRYNTPHGKIRRSFAIASNVFKAVQAKPGYWGTFVGKESISTSRLGDVAATVTFGERRQTTDPALADPWNADDWFYGIQLDNSRTDNLIVGEPAWQYNTGEISYRVAQGAAWAFADGHVKFMRMNGYHTYAGGKVLWGTTFPGYRESPRWQDMGGDHYWHDGLACFDSGWGKTEGDCPLPGDPLP